MNYIMDIDVYLLDLYWHWRELRKETVETVSPCIQSNTKQGNKYRREKIIKIFLPDT